MKRVVKIFASAAAVVAALLLILVVVIQLRWRRTFDAEYPAIKASSDPAVIAKGRYLAYGPAHCAYCHTSGAAEAALMKGGEPPLTGGHPFPLPIGTIYTPNLTPDEETGIGRLSDAQLARVIRHGVLPDNRAAVPFMLYQDLSDEDLTAVISFLRSQAPVRNAVPRHDLNIIGRAMMAFVIRPAGPSVPPPPHSPAGPTVERGRYLANSVGECVSCHTKRSHLDGSYLSAKFSGGEPFETSNASMIFVSPNLTPASNTGRIANWSEQQFVDRFRAGVWYPETPMPWPAFMKMNDDDLRALYRYLRTLGAVENATGPSRQIKKKG